MLQKQSKWSVSPLRKINKMEKQLLKYEDLSQECSQYINELLD